MEQIAVDRFPTIHKSDRGTDSYFASDRLAEQLSRLRVASHEKLRSPSARLFQNSAQAPKRLKFGGARTPPRIAIGSQKRNVSVLYFQQYISHEF